MKRPRRNCIARTRAAIPDADDCDLGAAEQADDIFWRRLSPLFIR
jgi:hypothetical protein